MKKNYTRVSVLLCGLALMVVSSLPAKSYPPFVRKAAKFGAQDCLFCHTAAGGGEGWNDRGKWLIAEREKRNADAIDVEWLAEFKAAEAKEGEKKEGEPAKEPGKEGEPAKEPGKEGATSSTAGNEHADHDKEKGDKPKTEDKDKDKDKEKDKKTEKKKPGTDRQF